MARAGHGRKGKGRTNFVELLNRISLTRLFSITPVLMSKPSFEMKQFLHELFLNNCIRINQLEYFDQK